MWWWRTGETANPSRRCNSSTVSNTIRRKIWKFLVKKIKRNFAFCISVRIESMWDKLYDSSGGCGGSGCGGGGFPDVNGASGCRHSTGWRRHIYILSKTTNVAVFIRRLFGSISSVFSSSTSSAHFPISLINILRWLTRWRGMCDAYGVCICFCFVFFFFLIFCHFWLRRIVIKKEKREKTQFLRIYNRKITAKYASYTQCNVNRISFRKMWSHGATLKISTIGKRNTSLTDLNGDDIHNICRYILCTNGCVSFYYPSNESPTIWYRNTVRNVNCVWEKRVCMYLYTCTVWMRASGIWIVTGNQYKFDLKYVYDFSNVDGASVVYRLGCTTTWTVCLWCILLCEAHLTTLWWLVMVMATTTIPATPMKPKKMTTADDDYTKH